MALDDARIPECERRDCAPHHGGVLYVLGLISFVSGVFGRLLLPAVIAVACGVVVSGWASKDLCLMRLGQMDPGGKSLTQLAQGFADLGVILGYVFGVLGSTLVLMVLSARS